MQKSYTLAAVGPATVIADAGASNEFHNMYIKVTSAAYDCVVAIETSIDGTTWVERDRVTGPNWAGGGMNFTERYARPNVINLGAAGHPLAVVMTGHL